MENSWRAAFERMPSFFITRGARECQKISYLYIPCLNEKKSLKIQRSRHASEGTRERTKVRDRVTSEA